jgi:hypothetical protein
VIDAGGREESSSQAPVLAAADLEVEPDRLCVGSGARRYRDLLEGKRRDIPPRPRRASPARGPASTRTGAGVPPAEEVDPLTSASPTLINEA